jgi:DMSO/TMAO reductase YedYZ molybdopterin-dependent catalytic subunit
MPSSSHGVGGSGRWQPGPGTRTVEASRRPTREGTLTQQAPTGHASISTASAPARVAGPEEGVSQEELALAARNHGLPLEALRYDTTPPGLHYTLVHYDIPFADEQDWTVQVTGAVRRPLTLDMAQLRERPARTLRVTFECAGNGRALLRPRPVSQPWLVEAVGTAEWTGVSLADLLREAGPSEEARTVVFTGADHGAERGVEQDYARGLDLPDALGEDVLLAYAMNGAPLPPQHGHPLRLVVPGWYGMAQVKWLREISVLEHAFDGFQNTVAYRLRQEPDEEGEAVTRMEPRALLVPPGFPDFMSRTRFVHPGAVTLTGRAWSGWGPVERVEVSTDGGNHWEPATLGPEHGRYAWRSFSLLWEAAPGHARLSARAYDSTGRAQPWDMRWSRGGFANNAPQVVPVVVLDDPA